MQQMPKPVLIDAIIPSGQQLRQHQGGVGEIYSKIITHHKNSGYAHHPAESYASLSAR
jgi:hypothetical protein